MFTETTDYSERHIPGSGLLRACEGPMKYNNNHYVFNTKIQITGRYCDPRRGDSDEKLSEQSLVANYQKQDSANNSIYEVKLYKTLWTRTQFTPSDKRWIDLDMQLKVTPKGICELTNIPAENPLPREMVLFCEQHGITTPSTGADTSQRPDSPTI